MKDPIYQSIELTGTSATSIEDAVSQAIRYAFEISPDLSWFQVIETRGSIDQDTVRHWQVTLKVGISLEAAAKALKK